MKYLSAAVAALALASVATLPALAGDDEGGLSKGMFPKGSTSYNVPTGIDVGGCTYLTPDGKPLCDQKSITQALKDGQSPAVGYAGIFTPLGSGGE